MKDITKAERLHLYRNRQDEPLFNNGILLPIPRNSGAGKTKSEMYMKT